MTTPNLPAKLISHGSGCPKCHGSDGINNMCRIGRRLYLGWFNKLDKDGKMFALVGMPDAMRKEVLEVAGLEGVSFGSDFPQ